MRVKIEFDLDEAIAVNPTVPLWALIEHVMSPLAEKIAEPGAVGGPVGVVVPGRWDGLVAKVGEWSLE